ncbi:uncharacterized protein LOC135713010 [Ochlerotatus camptorhynchus]|uniref:uncharacterized protein LOC135713010 n=1 Tax=Ochlerotatus camptorhynchus TaxID=644619 RepID=UPI0031D64B6A
MKRGKNIKAPVNDNIFNLALKKLSSKAYGFLAAIFTRCYNTVVGDLAFLDDDAIEGIQRDVQLFPTTTGQNEVEWKKILNYYGDLSEFRFTTGERSSLKMIAATIRRNGITKFSRSMLRSIPEQQQQASTYGTPDNENWLAEIHGANITISNDDSGRKVLVSCPFCGTIVMIRPEPTGTWKVSNFSAHIRSKHLSEPNSKQPQNRGTKRPYSEYDEQNAQSVLNEDCSIAEVLVEE